MGWNHHGVSLPYDTGAESSAASCAIVAVTGFSSAFARRRLLLTAAAATAAEAEAVAAVTVVTVACRQRRQISSAVNNYLSGELWASRARSDVAAAAAGVRPFTRSYFHRWPTLHTTLSTCCTSSNVRRSPVTTSLSNCPPPSRTTRRQPRPRPPPPTRTRMPSSYLSVRYRATLMRTTCVRCSKSSDRFTSWWCSKTGSPAYTRVYTPAFL